MNEQKKSRCMMQNTIKVSLRGVLATWQSQKSGLLRRSLPCAIKRDCFAPLAMTRAKGLAMTGWILLFFFHFLLLTSHFSLSYAEDKGPLISIELRDVDLSDVLRALGQEHGINIIVDEKVTGKVTVSLRNIPLWDAIDSILKGKGYAYIKEGDIVRIAPLIEDEDLVTRTINVKYANPKDIEPLIKKVLSKRGSVALALDPKTGVSSTSIGGGGSTDPRGVIIARNSMIVIKDIPSAIERAEQLLKQLDVKTRQIMIEAKIVEVNTNAREELGIQWGGMYRSGGDAWLHGGGLTSQTAAVPSTGTGITSTTGSGMTSLTGGIGAGGSALNVNLPAAVAQFGGGALGIGILANKLTLDLQISALEQQGNAKVLSSPKIMVLDNQDATIASGSKIVLRTSTTTTTGTTLGTAEKEATLRLTVTPHVIDNEQISLAISTKKEEFDYTQVVDGLPSILSRESQTGVNVKNGETIVIGGIYTERNFEGENGVPLLSRIPLLGWLFKKETKTKDKTELLIFITPRIKTEEI